MLLYRLGKIGGLLRREIPEQRLVGVVGVPGEAQRLGDLHPQPDQLHIDLPQLPVALFGDFRIAGYVLFEGNLPLHVVLTELLPAVLLDGELIVLADKLLLLDGKGLNLRGVQLGVDLIPGNKILSPGFPGGGGAGGVQNTPRQRQHPVVQGSILLIQPRHFVLIVAVAQV